MASFKSLGKDLMMVPVSRKWETRGGAHTTVTVGWGNGWGGVGRDFLKERDMKRRPFYGKEPTLSKG